MVGRRPPRPDGFLVEIKGERGEYEEVMEQGKEQNSLLEELQGKGILLNEQQKRAVYQTEGAVLLLAVPGAGKTTVITARTEEILRQNLARPDQILTMTFSREAARDMQRRYLTLFPDRQGNPPIFSTIHRFCNQILRRYARTRGTQPPALLEATVPGGRQAVLKELLLQLTHRYPDEDLVEQANALIGYAKNRLLSPDKVKYTDNVPLVPLMQAYEGLKRQRHWMDFDDMLCYALTILRRYPTFLEQIRQALRYLQIDEAQDTSLVQHEIIRLIAQDRNLFLVGDEDQSIYGFRGATPEKLLSFGTDYPGATILKLEQNYRSTQEIVRACDRMIAHNQQRYAKHMVTQREQGTPIAFVEQKGSWEQYAYLLQQIQAKPPHETMALLYRNNDSAFALVDLLSREGIPFFIREQRTSFCKSGVIQDILAFFALAQDPGDVRAFSRIYYKTFCHIRKEMALFVRDEIRPHETVFEALLRFPREENIHSGEILSLRNLFQRVPRESPRRAMGIILNDMEYYSALHRLSSEGVRPQDIQKVEGLLAMASRCQNIPEFLGRIGQLDDLVVQASKQGSQTLCLSTIHASKGLEYDTVVLLDAYEEILPSRQAIEDQIAGHPQTMEEEARLFYVGCTRAKDRLIIPFSRNSRVGELVPSRFIRYLQQTPVDMPDQLTEPVVGTWIKHQKFGEGYILSSSSKDRMFRVAFVQGPERTFVWDALLGQGNHPMEYMNLRNKKDES